MSHSHQLFVHLTRHPRIQLADYI